MIEVRTAVQATTSAAEDVRPVLTVMVGTARDRRAVISRVLDGLGEGQVVLPVQPKLLADDVRALHKVLAGHLAAGRSVLVDATNTHPADRRGLFDVATRFLACTMAVVCTPADANVETGIALASTTETITALLAEGWQAVVVAPR